MDNNVIKLYKNYFILNTFEIWTKLSNNVVKWNKNAYSMIPIEDSGKLIYNFIAKSTGRDQKNVMETEDMDNILKIIKQFRNIIQHGISNSFFVDKGNTKINDFLTLMLMLRVGASNDKFTEIRNNITLDDEESIETALQELIYYDEVDEDVVNDAIEFIAEYKNTDIFVFENISTCEFIMKIEHIIFLIFKNEEFIYELITKIKEININ